MYISRAKCGLDRFRSLDTPFELDPVMLRSTREKGKYKHLQLWNSTAPSLC